MICDTGERQLLSRLIRRSRRNIKRPMPNSSRPADVSHESIGTYHEARRLIHGRHIQRDGLRYMIALTIAELVSKTVRAVVVLRRLIREAPVGGHFHASMDRV